MADRFKMPPEESKEVAEVYEDAIRLVRGTTCNVVVCWVAVLAAVVLGAVSVYFGLGCAAGCIPSVCTVGTFCFLAAQSVTLGKMMQDYDAAKVGREKGKAELAFLHPTLPYAVQCVGFYIICIASVLYTIGIFVADVFSGFDANWRNLLILQVIWLSTVIANLIQAMKDKSDASVWRDVPPEDRPEKIDHIVEAAEGSRAHQVVVVIAFLVSVGATALSLYFVYTELPDGLRIVYFGVNANSMMQSFNFVKLDHDRNNHVELKKLKRQKVYQCSTVLTFLGSWGGLMVIGYVFSNSELERIFFIL